MSTAHLPVDIEVATFGHLDSIFDDECRAVAPPVDCRPSDVTIFTGCEPAALYVNGVLHGSGARDDLVADALALLGANVYTSNEHLLGQANGPAAPDLNTISVYVETIEKVEALRRDAEALRAEADYLEDEIKT